MSITNLTGTTWVINYPISNVNWNKSIMKSSSSSYIPNSTNSYNVEYTWNGYPSKKMQYIGMCYGNIGNGNLEYYLRYFDESTNVGWYSTNSLELIFTGGADVTNTYLINWLQSNATLQATSSTDTKPIFKRINGSWVKQDAFQRVSGAWVRISSKETTPSYTWKCTIDNLGSSSPSNVTFNHEGTMPTFEEVTFNGDVFIKIPTMYGKVNTVVDNQITSFTIANGKVDDSYLPFPVFVKEDGTSIMSYVLMGKYLNNSSSTMQSVKNTSPTNLTIGNARTFARNRGTGYQQYDWMFQRLWQYLIIAKMNTIDTNSGSGLQTDAFGIYWGKNSVMIDGICHNSGVIAVSYKPSKYVDSATTSTNGYTGISYNLPNSNGEISKLGYDSNNPFVNYPSSIVTNSSYNTYYCDGYYYNSNSRPVRSYVGGTSWELGAFHFNGNLYSWTATIPVRLCYRPVDE